MIKKISKEGEAFYYNKETNAFCLINKKKCYEFLCLIKPNLPIQFKNKNYIDIVKDNQFTKEENNHATDLVSCFYLPSNYKVPYKILTKKIK